MPFGQRKTNQILSTLCEAFRNRLQITNQDEEMKKMIISIPLAIIMLFALNTWQAKAAEKLVRISVIGDRVETFGNRVGCFNAMYNRKKIEVCYSHNNVKVYKGIKEIKDYEKYLFTSDVQANAINGRKIDLVGRWEGQKSYEAYKIYLPSDIKIIGER